jgi:hypothetical protein
VEADDPVDLLDPRGQHDDVRAAERAELKRLGISPREVDVERWTGRDDLCYALEAPIWDRFGSFAGQPQVAGTVAWTTADRRVVIEGRRGGQRFEELV